MALHSSLGDSLEDQISLAALHFNRGHHQVRQQQKCQQTSSCCAALQPQTTLDLFWNSTAPQPE
jgi:hypothetical protein